MDQPSDNIIKWAPVVVASGLLINFALAGHVLVSLLLFCGWLFPFLYAKGLTKKTIIPVIILALILIPVVFFQGGIMPSSPCTTTVTPADRDALELKINRLIGTNDIKAAAELEKEFAPDLGATKYKAGMPFSKSIGSLLNELAINPASPKVEIQKLEYDCKNKYYSLFWYEYR